MAHTGAFFDHHAAIAAVQYLLNNTKHDTYLPIFKLLYLAEKEHLNKHGMYFLGDKFCAKEYGPVPSQLFDVLKAMDESEASTVDKYPLFSKHLVVEHEPKGKISIKKSIDYTYHLGESAQDLLKEIAERYGPLSVRELIEVSHDKAWEKAWATGSGQKVIEVEDIAKLLPNAKAITEYLSQHS